MASAGQEVPAELVFVVDVSALTKKGFVGSTEYQGGKVDLEFDDGTDGLFLTSAMAARLRVKKGSRVSLIVEDDANVVADTSVGSVGKSLRISDPKVYYAIGKEGGAILRVRKA